jgi:hypothetical protein
VLSISFFLSLSLFPFIIFPLFSCFFSRRFVAAVQSVSSAAAAESGESLLLGDGTKNKKQKREKNKIKTFWCWCWTGEL